jgi:tRNA(Ile)-lysidine synthase
MSSLAAMFVRSVREAGLLGPGDRVVAAVSGGGDSVALLYLVAASAPALGCALTGVVHVHHGLRGAAADADQHLVAEHAAALRVPIVVECADVAALALARRCSTEAAGRAAREAAFARARDALGATHVATGHTLDDQAETVLLRLARGAGVSALSGIRRVRGAIVRPLLACRRADLRAYLEARGLRWREDETNADEGIVRNRVRHRVLPVLGEALSPRVAEALARVAELAASEDLVLEREVDRVAGDVIGAAGGPGPRWMQRAALIAQPVALQRRLVRRWLERAAPCMRPGVAHVDAVLVLAGSAADGKRLSLPGCVVTVAGGRLALLDPPAAPGGRGVERFSDAGPRHLPVPGVLSLAGLGMQLSAAWLPASGEAALGLVAERSGPVAAVLDAAAAGESLGVRFWRPGDRFRPMGSSGRRKLQDLFVDRKVPAGMRGQVPLVVDAHDRILWVAGHAIAADARVTEATTRVLLLQLQRSGGVV